MDSPATQDGRQRPIRRPVDDFDLGLEPTGGSTHSEQAVGLAQQIAFVFGPLNQAVQNYEQLFGYVPPRDLLALRNRGAIIVMSPTIPDWLCSDEATRRRSFPLTSAEKYQVKREYGPRTGTAAIYDPQTDSLVLPTREVSPDPLHPVLHEVGHALTLDRVWRDFRSLRGLLDKLPQRILDHLANGYPQGDDDDAIRIQIAEILAEAYAMLLAGREKELTPVLTSALVDILSCVSPQNANPGGSIDPHTGRTATYVPQGSMIRESGIEGEAKSHPPKLLRAGDRELLDRRARCWPPNPR